ncbi:MAG: hypothetical protein ACP5NS_01700 [Candidatus Pacearchaeota archaeon]
MKMVRKEFIYVAILAFIVLILAFVYAYSPSLSPDYETKSSSVEAKENILFGLPVDEQRITSKQQRNVDSFISSLTEIDVGVK